MNCDHRIHVERAAAATRAAGARLLRRATAAGALLLTALTLSARPAVAGGAIVGDATSTRASHASAVPAGQRGGPGLAILARKALAVPFEGRQVYDNAVLLIEDGRIRAIGEADEVDVPDGYEVVDAGERWIMPGMIDLHSHIAGTFDINDMVYLTNPGLRAYASVIPENSSLRRAVAAGVTSILFIPGSGTNMGGQGVLLKTGHDHYEEMQIRNPGSLKLAQAGNPEGFIMGVGRSFMNWHTRNTFLRGVAYAKKWHAYEQDGGPKPEKDLQLEIFRSLYENEAQISTHTQIYQVVNMTLTMVKEELGLPVFIDHGTFDGWRAGARAEALEVPAILGPRAIDVPTASFIRWSGSNPEAIRGCAAGYQEQGHTMIGFNTDAPVIPQEELPLQAAMGVRYGLDYEHLETVRGLTIVPAKTAGIDDRIGSLAPGLEADVLIVSGDPADPRCGVEVVFADGERVYDVNEDRRRW